MEDLLSRIKSGPIDFPSPAWNFISDAAKVQNFLFQFYIISLNFIILYYFFKTPSKESLIKQMCIDKVINHVTFK